MNRSFFIFLFIIFSIVSCQKDATSGQQAAQKESRNLDGTPNKGKIAPPPDNSAQVNFPPGQQRFMSGAGQLLQGAWVSQCYPATVAPHIPFAYRLPFYRMFYLLYPVDNNGNMLVQHFVREYNDPLCGDNFSGPFNPHTRRSIEIVGFYRISDQSALFPNVIQVSFEWTQCSGSCNMPQNPVSGVYLNQVKLAAFRESEDTRQVLFWGDMIPARPPSPTPFLADQVFQWNVPFYRLDF
jgi:hypothetical protein